MRSLCAAATALIVLAGAASAARATPTGLNNIPTAEVVDEGVLVLQGFSEFGRERAPGWFAGFKYGPAANWEMGLDDTVAGPGSAGGPTLQGKYRMPCHDAAALALGLANISDDRSRHGNVFSYAVVSGDLGPVNGHLGYSWQADNRAWFLGIDGAVSPELTLRADWTQAQDGDESVAGLGFIRSLSPRWLIEGWASLPTAEEAETSYIVKLDWVIPLPGRR